MNSVASGFALSLVLTAVFCGGSSPRSAHGAPTSLKAKPLGNKVLDAPKRPILRAIGERYRLRIRALIQRVSDPDDNDGRYECFGHLRVNGVMRWKIPVEEALNYRRGVGEQLDISGDTAHIQGGSFNFSVLYGAKRKESLQFVLSDRNQTRPQRIALYIDDLDLRKLGPSEYRCRNGGGDATLFVTIERTGFVFAPRLITPTPHKRSGSLKTPRLRQEQS